MGQKNPVIESKNPVFEGFGIKVQKTGSKTGVSKHSKFTENLKFVLVRTFWKNDVKLNFGNREKLVLTRKPTQMFGLKLGMQGLRLLDEITWPVLFSV